MQKLIWPLFQQLQWIVTHDGNDFTDIETEEEGKEGDANWVNTPYFLIEAYSG